MAQAATSYSEEARLNKIEKNGEYLPYPAQYITGDKYGMPFLQNRLYFFNEKSFFLIGIKFFFI